MYFIKKKKWLISVINYKKKKKKKKKKSWLKVVVPDKLDDDGARKSPLWLPLLIGELWTTPRIPDTLTLATPPPSSFYRNKLRPH